MRARVINTAARLALVWLLALVARGAPAQEARDDNSLRDNVKETLGKLPVYATYPLQQFIAIDLRGQTLAAEVPDDLPVRNDLLRIAVQDSDAIWTVRKRVIGNLNSLYVTVVRYDCDAPPDALWTTTLTLRSGYFAVSAVQGSHYDGMRVRLTQANGSLSFTCNRIDRGMQKTLLVASALSLRQLQAEHPQEVRRFLDPMLFSITGRHLLRPGAADVYRAFASVAPDPQAVKQLQKVIAGLESDSFTKRQRADRDLRELGAPGVLAAIRRDNGDLSAEAKSRIDAFIAVNSTMSPEELAKALQDPAFLLDCMDDDSLAVRTAAKQALEKQVGQAVDFDPALGASERAVAVDALRTRFFKRSATRPVQQNVTPRVIR